MFVLGLQGSPRAKGNSSILLSTFMNEAENLGARIHLVDVAQKHIEPCMECGTCENKGFCAIVDDDMQHIYPLLRRADLIVMATPIFFYGPTAQMKALIDRSQALWARRYTLGLSDPGRQWRKGLLLALGATKGKNLFEGTMLTAKYFFDAVGAHFEGGLTYKQIEGPGEIKKHPTALNDAQKKARELVTPYLNRKKILFVCRENACRSQMASAFAQQLAGDRIAVEGAGSAPAGEINPVMVEAMKEKKIDMAYRKPKSFEKIGYFGDPELMVTMGCDEACPFFPGVRVQDWQLPDPAGKPIEFMREIRDQIEERVKNLIASGILD